ncbi:MAG: GTP-binding protein, partial [Candidatus Binatia bacterium]
MTVVDALAWQAAWRISGAARRQLAAADFLVISKTDIAPRHGLARLRSRLSKLNPRALVLESAGEAAFPGSELLFATSAARCA